MTDAFQRREVGAKFLKPFSLVFNRTSILKSKHDMDVVREVFISGKHFTNDVSGKPVLISRAHDTPDNPEDLSDCLLIMFEPSVIIEPYWKGISQIEEPWHVSEANCPSSMFCLLGRRFASDTFHGSTCLERCFVSHQCVQ